MGDGEISHSRTIDGDGIRAGGKSMIPDDAEPRIIARWVGGIEDLQRRRFIRDPRHEGKPCRVTREGYEAADELPDT